MPGCGGAELLEEVASTDSWSLVAVAKALSWDGGRGDADLALVGLPLAAESTTSTTTTQQEKNMNKWKPKMPNTINNKPSNS